MDTELIVRILKELDAYVTDAVDAVEKHRWMVMHTYVTISYVLSLRGTEGLLLDLSGLWKHWTEERDYVIVTLLGRVKGESGDRRHLLPAVDVTSSGIRVKRSISRLMYAHSRAGRKHGPAIADERGNLFTSRDLNLMFLEAIEPIFDQARELFPPDMERQQLSTAYQVFRTLRKSSDSRALNQGVGKDDIDLINRWSKQEGANGRKPTLEMRQYYAQMELITEPFLRYTKAM
jgi:hypothetical protein